MKTVCLNYGKYVVSFRNYDSSSQLQECLRQKPDYILLEDDDCCSGYTTITFRNQVDEELVLALRYDGNLSTALILGCQENAVAIYYGNHISVIDLEGRRLLFHHKLETPIFFGQFVCNRLVVFAETEIDLFNMNGDFLKRYPVRGIVDAVFMKEGTVEYTLLDDEDKLTHRIQLVNENESIQTV